jgi:hypothetical protein
VHPTLRPRPPRPPRLLDASFGAGGKAFTDLGTASHEFATALPVAPSGDIVGSETSLELDIPCVARERGQTDQEVQSAPGGKADLGALTSGPTSQPDEARADRRTVSPQGDSTPQTRPPRSAVAVTYVRGCADCRAVPARSSRNFPRPSALTPTPKGLGGMRGGARYAGFPTLRGSSRRIRQTHGTARHALRTLEGDRRD